MPRSHKIGPLVVPGLRGNFGDWIYYACLVPINEIDLRVDYATEIHRNNKALSDLIQRSLEGRRAEKIARYLQGNTERFFSSLVLAVYGGSPQWLEVGNIRETTNRNVLKEISDAALDSVGFLRFSGSEHIFAVDGQHRVAGIKRACKERADLNSDLVPVLFVGHERNSQGLQRTRRLFTTLNKHAVPVSKKDIIALDEDDVMAITVRRMVEEERRFSDPRIAITISQQIPASNDKSLTTIGNLYDVLKIVFMHADNLKRDDSLRFNRPDDGRLERYFSIATDYFGALANISRPLKTYFSHRTARVNRSLRSSSGGDLLFRPIGLEILTRVAVRISRVRSISLTKAVHALRPLPTRLERSPFRHVIWDPATNTVVAKGRRLAIRISAYMLGLEEDKQELLVDYRRACGCEPDDASVQLPAKLK